MGTGLGIPAAKTPVQILTSYFNVGDGKRPISEWRKEVNAFTLSERRAFATEVCRVTGDRLAE